MYRRPLQAAFGRLIDLARRTGAALEDGRVSFLRALLPYARNPYLVPDSLARSALRLPLVDEAAPAGDRRAYDENLYRLPIGATVMWIVVFLAGLALTAFVAGP